MMNDFYSRASSFSTGIQSRFVSANRTFETRHARALPDRTLYSLPRLNAKTGEIEKNLHFRNDETYENVLIGQALPGLTIAGMLLASIAVAVVLKSGALFFLLYLRFDTRRSRRELPLFVTACTCFIHSFIRIALTLLPYFNTLRVQQCNASFRCAVTSARRCSNRSRIRGRRCDRRNL